MNQRRLVKKTLENRRGYKYHTYETTFAEEDGSEELCVYHYGTLILRVDLTQGIPISSRITSVSDRDMVNVALGQVDTRNRMSASKGRGIEEKVSENRFLRHVSGEARLFDRAERIDRDSSALAVENLSTGKVEAFETSTRQRKFWLKQETEDGGEPDLYGREAKESVKAEYLGDVEENEELIPLVVGHTLKNSRSATSPH